jgi:hypothetical protein
LVPGLLVRGLLVAVLLGFDGREPAEQAVTFVINARAEEQSRSGTRTGTVAKGQRPQAMNGDE